MGMTILKKKTGYALGLLLCIIGGILLLVLLWKWWDTGVFTSSDMLSELSASFLEEYPDIDLGIGLKLIHYTFLGAVFLVAGSAILVARRERVTVTEEVTVLLECPQCKNQWRESMSRTHLESMGYPRVRTLSRHKCSKCAKFMRPKIVATDV
ncbi:MAG: hypothetical protein ACETVP_04170 [Candidatus Bathyarchaeia archaeon]|jgi:hypothetical protein